MKEHIELVDYDETPKYAMVRAQFDDGYNLILGQNDQVITMSIDQADELLRYLREYLR